MKQIYEYCHESEGHHKAITSDNTQGPVKKLLLESRLGSKETHLNTMTMIENFERKFIRSKNAKDVDDQLHRQIIKAFEDYLKTIPENKKELTWSYKVNTNFMNFFFLKFIIIFPR